MQDFFGWDIGARSTILHQRSRFNVEEYNDIAKRIMKIKEQITQSKSQNS